MSRKHQRTSSSGKKLHPPAARPKSPALSRRGHSHGHLPFAATTASTGRSLLGGARKTTTEIVDDPSEEESGTASFLQFCTTCERQIVSPGSNILYCSEACREKDTRKSMLYVDDSLNSSPSLASSFSARSSYFDLHNRQHDILPQRSPTVPRPLSMTFSDVSTNNGDPTYDLSASFEPSRFHHQHRDREQERETEASRYLSLFKNNPSTTTSRSMDPTTCLRPSLNRLSTATDGGIPSLSHTPSSSVGTTASDLNFNNFSMNYATSTSTSYRPLPPRHEPQTSLNNPFARKSIDLVTPSFARLSTHQDETADDQHHQNSVNHSDQQKQQQQHRRQTHHQRNQSREILSLKSFASTMTSFYAAEAEDAVVSTKSTITPSAQDQLEQQRRLSSWRPWNDDC